MVGGFQGRKTAGSGKGGAGAKLRSARRGGACGGGARQRYDFAVRSVSAIGSRRGNYYGPDLARRRNPLAGIVCTLAKRDIWPGHSEPAFVRAGYLGPFAASHRSSSRKFAGVR